MKDGYYGYYNKIDSEGYSEGQVEVYGETEIELWDKLTEVFPDEDGFMDVQVIVIKEGEEIDSWGW